MEKIWQPHVQRKLAMHYSPRCLAKSRAGGQCQMPAMRGKKRCRLHGGKSTGRPIIHGRYSKDIILLEKSIKSFVNRCVDNIINFESDTEEG